MILKDYKVFFDMDGVLVDIVKGIQRIYPGWQEGDDLDWVDLHAKNPHFFMQLEPMQDIGRLLRGVHYTGAKMFILTALPRRWSWPDITYQKRVSAHRLFPEYFWGDNTLFGPYAEDKRWHCGGRNTVLIDDLAKNVQQWNEQGGTGILHKSVDETLDALYDTCINREIANFKEKQGVWRK